MGSRGAHAAGAQTGAERIDAYDVEKALERGDERIDLLYTVPAEVGPAAAEFNRLLDEADEFCRAGDLLTLATPPDTAAFRRWFLDHLRGPDRERTTDAVAGVRPVERG